MRIFTLLSISLFFISLCFAGSISASSDPIAKVQSLTKKLSEATKGRLHVSGYINAHIMEHKDAPVFTNKNLNEPFYQLREASVFADLTISNSLLFSTELELSYDFTDKNDSGRSDSFEALLNYYYLEWDIAEAFEWDTDTSGSLKVRFGRLLVPFLSYNESKPSFSQNLMSQPFTAWQLSPVNNVAGSFKQFGWTDKGLSINWNYAGEDTGIIDIKLSIINGLGTSSDVLDGNTVQLNPPGALKPTIRPRDGLFNTKSEWDSFSDVNNDRALVLKVSYIPLSLPLNVGVSGYRGAWSQDGKQNLSMYGFHLQYHGSHFKLKSEYLIARVDQKAGINVVSKPGPAAINVSTGDYKMKAWYVEGVYTWLRYGGAKQRYFSTILRLDDLITNDQVVFSPFNRSRVTLGAEWQFMRNIRLRGEWQRSNLKDFNVAPGPYVAAGGGENIDMKMISLIAYF